MSITDRDAGVRVARVGAAAFALGFLIAGPQAAGTAAADTGGETAPAASAAGTNSARQDSHPSPKTLRAGIAGVRSVTPPARPAAGPARSVGKKATRPLRDRILRAESAASRPEPTRGTDPIPAAVFPPPAPQLSAAAGPVPPLLPTAPRSSRGSVISAPLVASTHSTPAKAGGPVVTYITELRTATESFVVGLRDLLANPGGPFEFAQGAALLVRRSYFNQMPTADPFEYLIRADGELDGTVGATDPEKAVLSYTVVTAPQHGTVTVDSDGQYAYTPAPGYTGEDGFTVDVADPGFNALRPFVARVKSVQVPVTSAPRNEDWTVGPITNGTTRPVKVDSTTFSQAGFRPDWVPPVNTVIQPGDTLRVDLTKHWRFLFFVGETPMENTKTATVRLRDNQLPEPQLWTVAFTSEKGPIPPGYDGYGDYSGYSGSCPNGHCDVTNDVLVRSPGWEGLFNTVRNLTLLPPAPRGAE